MTHVHPALFGLLPLLAATATAQLRIDEILVDPVGPDVGRQKIELRSHGAATDLDGYQLVTGANVLALPAITLPADGIVVLQLGAAGPNSTTELYFPAAAPLQAADSVALFRGTPITSGTNLVDFVSFGGGQTTLPLALQMQLWAGPQATVQLPQTEGATIARCYELPSPNLLRQWYGDRTPTLGRSNDYAGFYSIGGFCSVPGASTQSPRFSQQLQGLPWIGTTWNIRVGELPPTGGTFSLLVGTEIPTTYLFPQPYVVCMTRMTPFAVQTYNVPIGAGVQTYQIPIPDDPSLTGVSLAVQGLGSGYLSAFPFGLTQTMRVLLGRS